MKIDPRTFSFRIATLLVGLALLLAAGIFLIGDFREERRVEVQTRELLIQAEKILQEQPQEPSQVSSVEESADMSQSQRPTPWAAYDVVGVLTIPDLWLTLPILGEYSHDLLAVAPCVFAGSWEAGPQGLVIAGHNYRIHFKDIGELPLGAEVTFQTLEGEEYTLVVEEVTEIAADEPEKLKAEQWDMTLLTCNSDRSKRILVRCRTSEKPVL